MALRQFSYLKLVVILFLEHDTSLIKKAADKKSAAFYFWFWIHNSKKDRGDGAPDNKFHPNSGI